MGGGNMRQIALGGYRVTDDFFGKPFIDKDEVRADPSSHRFIHGGFEGTDTRFAFFDRSLRFDEKKTFEHFGFVRNPEDDAAASAKARASIMTVSPFVLA